MPSFKMITWFPPWPHVASIIHFLSGNFLSDDFPPIQREKKIGAGCKKNYHLPTLTFFDMGFRAGGQICATGVNLANLCHRVNAANCPLTRVSGLTSTAQENRGGAVEICNAEKIRDTKIIEIKFCFKD